MNKEIKEKTVQLNNFIRVEPIKKDKPGDKEEREKYFVKNLTIEEKKQLELTQKYLEERYRQIYEEKKKDQKFALILLITISIIITTTIIVALIVN